MMLRNIFLKSLRDNRAGVLVWGAGFGLLTAVGAAQYTQIIGQGPERARLAAELAKAFQAFSFVLGEITALDTIGGFITTRVLGFAPVMLGLWVAIVAVGLIRGEEQQGALDMLLATPRSRTTVLREKIAALLVIIAAATILLGIGLLLGIASSGEPVPAAEIGLTLLNIAAIMTFWGAVGLVMGQVVLIRRTASSITGALIFGTFLLNNVLEGVPTLKWLTWLLPFRYYAASKPLVPGREMEWGAWLVLVAMAGALLVLAGGCFIKRDIGSTFHLFPSRARAKVATGGSTSLLGTTFGKNIRDLLWPTFFWSLGLGIYALVIVSTIKETLGPMEEVVKNMGWLALIVGNIASPAGYLSFSIFTYLPALLAAFAITQVEGWSSEEEEGRVEVLATMPQPRWRLLAARYVAISLALSVIIIVLGACLLLGAAASNVDLDAGRVWAALVAVVPVSLAVAAMGLSVATWLKRPGTAVPITIGVVVVMFFLEIFSQILGLPQVVLDLSVFHLYGRPMVDGVRWGEMVALVAATTVLCAVSLVGLNRRDIAK